ncbi:hypothetical protein [Metaplanococcus flavidus]|uniref:Uncharacterized protein n=1 Tax=Metaplanococcus flavidus TaxID=569883 RepID=A0ABW3LAC7_9BACL
MIGKLVYTTPETFYTTPELGYTSLETPYTVPSSKNEASPKASSSPKEQNSLLP